jgi:hypothetical protein
MNTTHDYWNGKVSHLSQLGGIETSILDNGPGKGVRIAWFNTGSGLRFKVVLDRTMDIAEAFFNQHSLAWISHPGVTAPNPAAFAATEWLRSFTGGLLTTCGLSHAGPPEEDESDPRGIHGRIGNLQAELVSVVQPDMRNGTLEMGMSGVTRESRVFGPSLEMARSISARLGEAKIRISDEVRNCGNEQVPHMLLYHFNCGWPLVNEGTGILWKGAWESRGLSMDDALFREGHDFRTCPPPMDAHKGGGEACGFIDMAADREGNSICGLYNPGLNLALSIRYKKSQLPAFTNWQHWGRGEYVTGLEPGTNRPIGQAEARRQGTLIMLEPGETRHYELELEVLNDKGRIQDLLNEIEKQT